MQLLSHETLTSESELVDKIKYLISTGHCIQSVERCAIDGTTYSHTDKRFVNAYEIRSVTVAPSLETPQ